MSTDTRAVNGPDWLAAEMPPGYHNRVAEIQRLSRELEEIGRFGRLLWTVGPELSDAVQETLVAFDFDTAMLPGPNGSVIAVKLDATKRVLIHVSASEDIIQRRGEDLARVFEMLHQLAGDGDRVVLVANQSPSTRPAERRDGMDAEALALLKRLGANYLPAPSLFALWTLSLQDRARARAIVDRLHEQDGGVFVLPVAVGV
jgi:hypothetical protein